MTDIKLRPDCELAKELDKLEDAITVVAFEEFHCQPEGTIEAAINSAEKARAHLLEVIRLGHIKTQDKVWTHLITHTAYSESDILSALPWPDGLQRRRIANEIMGCDSG